MGTSGLGGLPHTAVHSRYLVDLRPEQLQAFSTRVSELAQAAGFTPHMGASPSETFARFRKSGDSAPSGLDPAVGSEPAPCEVLALPLEVMSLPDPAPATESPTLSSQPQGSSEEVPALSQEALATATESLAQNLESAPTPDQAPHF